jgi:hypothetical protein
MIVIGSYWVPVSNFHDDCCCISVDFSARASARSRSSIPSKVFYKIFRGRYDTDLAVSQDRVGNTPTDLSTRIAASFSSISQKTREAVGLNDWCMSFRYAFSRSLYELQSVFRMDILRRTISCLHDEYTLFPLHEATCITQEQFKPLSERLSLKITRHRREGPVGVD